MAPGTESPVDWDRSYLTGRAYNPTRRSPPGGASTRSPSPAKEQGFLAWGVSRIEWSGSGVVLDVGCGNGMWQKRLLQALPGLPTVDLDLSEGMLASLLAGWDGPRSAAVAVADADAQRLRLPTTRWMWPS